MAKVIKFSSGLEAIYQRRRDGFGCSFAIYVNAGSRNENKEENGIAHFIEHMTFKGTEKRTALDVATDLEKVGTTSNAFTSRLNTVYYFRAMDKYFKESLEIFSDMFFNSTFTQENIEKEKGVVLEEIKMYDDEGDSVCSDLLNKKSYGKNSMARPILGTEKTVKSFSRENILSFIKRYYGPDNVFLVYVGSLDEKTFIEEVEEKFNKPYLEREYDKKVKPKCVKKLYAGYAENTDKPFEQANVMIRFPAKGKKISKYGYLSTITFILGGGMSSRLFQKIREEKGLAYDVYCTSNVIDKTGVIDVGLGTSPSQAKEAVLAVREVIEKFKNEGITEEEFMRAQVQREASMVFGAESGFSELRTIGINYSTKKKIITIKKALSMMKNIKFEEMNENLKEYFDFDKAQICYVGKKIDGDLERLFKRGEN